jgi:DNA-binding PadR family transcriptional regulator
VEGRRRRVYRLTPPGRRELESSRREWLTFSRVVEGVLP